MIHQAQFQNFKALRDVEITFDNRLTVLVGPNGSGKTSVLQGIEFLCQAAGHGTNGNSFNPQAIAQRVSSGAKIAELNLELVGRGSDEIETTVRIAPPSNTPSNQPRQQIGPLALLISRNGESPKQWVNQAVPLEVTAPFRSTRLLRLDPGKLAAASQPSGIPPTMQSDGAGLASMLAYVALNQPEQFQSIVGALKQVIHNVTRLRFDKVQQAGFGDEILFDFQGAPGVKASFASNGTLYALGLVAAILGTNQPNILLLDDIDHGLHPKAQADLLNLLHQLLAQHPDLQIVATTHSVYILHWLEYAQIRLMTLTEDGSAVCGRLDEHPDFERWKDHMTPGEFWTHVGEDWLLKKVPVEAAS